MESRVKSHKPLSSIPTDENWQVVLLEIYRYVPHRYGESHKATRNDDKHSLARKLGISGYELSCSISFLEDNKLIESSSVLTPLNVKDINPDWCSFFMLTEKGIDVAL